MNGLVKEVIAYDDQKYSIKYIYFVPQKDIKN